MTNPTYTERTSTAHAHDSCLTGEQQSDLCVRARIVKKLLRLDLLAAPEINSVGRLPLRDYPGHYYDKHVIDGGGSDRIGVNLGVTPVDTTPAVVYMAAKALYAHFGGELAVDEVVEPQRKRANAYIRPCTITRTGFSNNVTVPALDGLMQPTDRKLTFSGVCSTDVGETGLAAMLSLYEEHQGAFSGVSDFALDLPPVTITSSQ
jgi:hypothetical protein